MCLHVRWALGKVYSAAVCAPSLCWTCLEDSWGISTSAGASSLASWTQHGFGWLDLSNPLWQLSKNRCLMAMPEGCAPQLQVLVHGMHNAAHVSCIASCSPADLTCSRPGPSFKAYICCARPPPRITASGTPPPSTGLMHQRSQACRPLQGLLWGPQGQVGASLWDPRELLGA